MNQLFLIGMMVVAAAAGAVGQISLAKVSGLPIMQMPFSGYAWLFAASYGAAVIINIVAYKLGGKPSVLYPVIALSYAFVAIISWKFLGEQISGWSIAGICCIMFGVGLIGYGV